VAPKLDRLARSVPDARQIGGSLAQRGIRLQLGTMVYDPTDPMGKMFFNILATFAEFEVDLLRMRTREGMAIAKAKGKLKGRAPKLSAHRQANEPAQTARRRRAHRCRARRTVRGVPAHGVPDPGTRADGECRRVSDLGITISADRSGITHIRVAGEVDIATAPQITDTVHEAITAGAREVLLDMAEVTFLDSTGIGALLQIKHAAADHDVALGLVDPHPRVVRVLQLTGLLDVLQDGTAIQGRPRASPQPAGGREAGDTAMARDQ
jgi:anti-anti-sigma factor